MARSMSRILVCVETSGVLSIQPDQSVLVLGIMEKSTVFRQLLVLFCFVFFKKKKKTTKTLNSVALK